MNPQVKMLLNYRKEWLVLKAKELGINPVKKTKSVLAEAISERELLRSEKDWQVISGGNRCTNCL